MAKKKLKKLKVVKFSPDTKLHIETLIQRLFDVVEEVEDSSKGIITFAEIIGSLEIVKNSLINKNMEE